MSPDIAENAYQLIRTYANNKDDFTGLEPLRITNVL